MQQELMNLCRTARLLGVPAKWLREEAEAGRVPCLRAGTRMLFNPLAVQQMLAERAAQFDGRREVAHAG